MARTQESLGEQEASRANLNAIETTRDVSHAERLDETQTIAETIEILKEDQTDAVWNFTQRTSFADGKESKSRLFSDLEEHINAISFLQVTQSEPARLESVNTATEPEAVHTSDESTGKAEMAWTAKIREELRQMSCLDSYWYWRVLAESTILEPENFPKSLYKQLVCDTELTLRNEASMQDLSSIELHEHLNSSHIPGSFGTIENSTLICRMWRRHW